MQKDVKLYAVFNNQKVIELTVTKNRFRRKFCVMRTICFYVFNVTEKQYL